jgi:glutamate-ammonia-ligase adenylyltransferase
MDGRVNPVVRQAIDELPEALRADTLRRFERLCAEADDSAATVALMASLVRVVAVSDFAAATIQKEWSWLAGQHELLAQPSGGQGLAGFTAGIGVSDEPQGTVKEELRRFRNRYLLHVLWREVEGLATIAESLAALSRLAESMLDAATGYARRQLEPRFGTVRDETGEPVPLVILGMGKLGGAELNFSSDIDIVFLYPGGADSDGERPLSATEYFTRLSRAVVALLDEVTGDGFVFRVDTRLRPFGDSGPPVVSFAALESYLLQHGRAWERYAYVKARIVGPMPPAPVVAELHEGLIRPFVYRRYLDFGIFESLREMHGMIAAEVRRRELRENIKLGPGGIREIEFIVQSLQLVRGGNRPDLQERNLQTVVPRLTGRRGLDRRAADTLVAAYCFLRRLENFIQAMRDRQLHELPNDDGDRQRLCLAMGYPDWAALRADIERHRGAVSAQFEAIAFRQPGAGGDADIRKTFAELWSQEAECADWERALGKAGFAGAEGLAATISAFARARATRQIDKESQRRLLKLMPDLICLMRTSARPVDTLQRALAIVENVLRRSAYIALLNENTAALERLVDLCERSAYLAEQIGRHPMLLDELLDPRLYAERTGRQEFEVELAGRLRAAGELDSESAVELLSGFQRASLFRIAVADFSGALPIMQVSDALTDLAETVLNRALEVAWLDMLERYGAPGYRVGSETRRAGFGIIAYGKFGGIELSYGSDLDLVFLHDSRGERQVTDGPKPLDNAVFFTRLLRRLLHFLTTQTPTGMLYEIDTRLRPDGHKGVLVTSIDAFERYQEDNAWTWEHQALLRARPVAGSAIVAREFERIRAETLVGRVRRDRLLADVLDMRKRMRAELDKSDTDEFDLKQGLGGIGDIEFIVQYLVLANSGRHRSLIHYPDNIRQLATLAAAGILSVEDALRLQDVYRAYRLRLHHLSLDDRQPIVGQGEFTAEREYVQRVWDAFLGG